MGFCLSCYRGRKPRKDIEREPLLRSHSSELPQTRSAVEHIADVLAALHSGKLPSQDQINTALGQLLRSDFLRVDSKHPISGVVADSEGKQFIGDVKEVIQAIVQTGVEKNGLRFSRTDG